MNDVEAEKKLTDLANKVAQVSERGFNFLIDRMYFAGDNGYKNFKVFAPVLSSLILDSNKKVTNWMSISISSGKIKPFHNDLEPTNI